MNKLFKQSFEYFRKNITNVIIMCILVFMTSFMYFIVQCSIDKNIANINNKHLLSNIDKEVLIGLKSNSILALVFLICLVLITGFVFFMFYKKNFQLTKKDIGCYRALGFTNFEISKMYITISIILSIIFALLGLLFGYYFSYILLENYRISYGVQGMCRGIKFRSFVLGVIGTSLAMGVATKLACKSFCNKETSELINGENSEQEGRVVNKTADILSKFIVSRYSFSARLALRKPSNIILIFFSVYIFLVLFVLSISLNLSSGTLYSSQTQNRSYSYEVTFDYILQKYNNSAVEDYFLCQEVSVNSNNTSIGKQELIGIDNGNNYFNLTNGKNNIKLNENQIVINKRLSEIYGLKAGDHLEISIENNKCKFIIQDIAENCRLNYIYINRSNMANILGINSDSYNGIWCSELRYFGNGSKVISYDEYLSNLSRENVSNRTSAVINQILACIFGILLIFLTLLLNFQDNTNNFIYLKKMGYLRKEINQMLINIYRPLIIIAFVISIIPGIYTCKGILKVLSLQTGDYMPFKSNILVIAMTFILINTLYIIVAKLFDFKLKKLFTRCTEEGN